MALTACRLLYGPDRLPLEESATATAACWDYRPFHGIVSLGLRAHPACTPDGWRAAAPLLDDEACPDGGLAAAARACGVLSFDESVAAAAHAAREYGDGTPPAELWNLKEGHTSSVWRATYRRADDALCHVAFNVARDAAAARALDDATTVYRELAECAPAVAPARVLAVWKLRRAGGGEPVTVVAQAWVDGAYEINALRVGADARARLVAVERFIPDPALPARVQSVRGRGLTDDEHARVGERMATLLRLGARRDGDGWHVPRFDVGHGDWVWRDDGPAAIACGATLTAVPGGMLRDAVGEALRDTCDSLDAEYARAVSRGVAAALSDGGAS